MIISKLPPVGLLLLLIVPTLATAQQPRQEDFYEITSFVIPEDINLEVGGMQLMPDGQLAVSTRRGDIYLVSNPTEKNLAEKAEFTLFAQGLHEVLGLAYRDGWLYATQRGELTRMKDTNGDGKADLFETVSDGWEINGDYHEYAFGSKFDKDGYIWITLCLTGSFTSQVPFRGWCVRVNAEGKMIPTCSGIRSPGGMGMNAVGDVFYTDNQGPWNGTSGLKHLVPGHFMGNPSGNQWYEIAENMGPRPQDPESGSRLHIEADKIPEFLPPAILFPFTKMGQSASGIEYDRSEGKFGPFAEQMLVGDHFLSTVMRVSLEKVKGRYQGACYPMLEGIASGTLPLEMDTEGNLFVGATNRGWGSRGNKPYSLQRVNWTGVTPFTIYEVKARNDGFELIFTQPIDPTSIEAEGAITIGTYTYIYQSSYGSPEVDHTEPTITGIEVRPDGKSLVMKVDQLQRGHIHEIKTPGIRDPQGNPLWHPIAYYTLNNIPD